MLKDLLDPYELKARIAPGLIIALPVLADALYSSPSLSGWPIFTFESACGLALIYGLSYIVRGRGEGIEKELWESWGGPPSTRVMRDRDNTWTTELKTAISQAVTKALSARLPAPEEEKTNRLQADKVIADAFRQVRQYLRQHDPNGLWFKHNIEYGFSRNLLGCRLLWALIAFVATIFAAIYGEKTGGHILNPASAVGLLSLLSAIFVGWFVLPTATKHIADGYAESAWMAFLEMTSQSSATKKSEP